MARCPERRAPAGCTGAGPNVNAGDRPANHVRNAARTGGVTTGWLHIVVSPATGPGTTLPAAAIPAGLSTWSHREALHLCSVTASRAAARFTPCTHDCRTECVSKIEPGAEDGPAGSRRHGRPAATSAYMTRGRNDQWRAGKIKRRAELSFDAKHDQAASAQANRPVAESPILIEPWNHRDCEPFATDPRSSPGSLHGAYDVLS